MSSKPQTDLADRSLTRKSGILTFFRELWWFLGTRKRSFLVAMFFILICSTTSLIPPWFLAKTLEHVQQGKGFSHIFLYPLAMTGILLILHILRVYLKNSTANARATISAEARQRAIDLLLSEGLRDGRLVGNEVSRLDTGLRDFGELHRMFQNEVLFCCVSFIACLVVFITQSATLLISTAVYLIAFFSVLRWSLPRVRKAQTSVSLARESFSGMFANVVGNALSVQASGAENSIGKKVGSSVSELERSEHQRNRAISTQWASLNLLNTLYLGVTLCQIGYGGISGALGIPLMVIAYSYCRELARSIVGIMDVAENFIQSYVGFGRLLHLLSANDEVFSRPETFPEEWKSISLNHISHRYPGMEREVLDDLSWEIPRGARIGLQGHSGAGKSTLIKILLGLIHPNKGEISVDGVSLSKISRASLRQHLGIALQECEILGLSLRENITLCRPVEDEWLSRTIDVAGLTQVIARLPDGLETLVGEKGYKLSGGERQRVALARAILRKPTLLVIDEATSMLDARTEELFFKQLDEMIPGLTLVIISHHERSFRGFASLSRLANGHLEDMT